MEKKIHELVNDYRRERELPELKYLDDVADAGYTHSEAMAKGKRRFGHDGFEDRFKALKLPYPDMHAFAENVAYKTKDAADAVDLWLHSKGHRKNIEGNYTHTGVGVARAKDGVYYLTQVFIRR